MTEPAFSVNRLLAALGDLTEQQRAAVMHDGNLSLLARPGSGKTRTVGLRLARAIQSGDVRVAVASYTNVAVDEIHGVCQSVGAVVGPRHFVGTLHGFFLDYVLRPYAHFVRKNPGPIHVRDGSWDGWRHVDLNEAERPANSTAAEDERPRGRMPLRVSEFHFDRKGQAVCHARMSRSSWKLAAVPD